MNVMNKKIKMIIILDKMVRDKKRKMLVRVLWILNIIYLSLQIQLYQNIRPLTSANKIHLK